MIEQPDEVMTLDELAAYLKLPKSTLYKQIQEGKIPGQKIGKQWRFGKRAIDRWINEEPLRNGLEITSLFGIPSSARIFSFFNQKISK